MLVRVIIYLFLVFFSSNLYSQADKRSSFRKKLIELSSNQFEIDSQLINSNSLKCQIQEDGSWLEKDQFQLIGNNLQIDSVFQSENSYKHLIISYRVLPFQWNFKLSHLDSSQLKPVFDDNYIGFEINPYENQNNSLIEFNKLDYDGSFARGLSFGNNQSLVLNSSLNLQLAGDIGDNIKLLAAISDNNIPLQPAGNTQQIQEFDRIFIQLTKGNNQLLAGDYDLVRPNSYFINYFKKLKGVDFRNTTNLNKERQIKTQVSTAVTKGKFARITLAQEEGNQGPYRLIGIEGERFIIVLANSERIYIDGQLLTRGRDHDYTIDYDRAELIFTSKRLINKDSRIIVEYEYRDQNYLRSTTALQSSYASKKLNLRFNIYNEQDSKTSLGDLDLTAEDRFILDESGDNLSNASKSSVQLLEGGFDPNRIMYELIDTLSTQVLKFSTDEERALYVATFNNLGNGLGSYALISPTPANGRVFEYVGIGQGSFEPESRLIAPNRQQMISLGADYALSKNTSISSEISMSNFDANRFSGRDDGDNQGLAMVTNFKQNISLGKKASSWRLESNLSYEYVQDQFNIIKPYRNQEFSRDWNINPSNKANEYIYGGNFSLYKEKHTQIEYSIKKFDRQNLYKGNKHAWNINYNKNGWAIKMLGSYLSAEDIETTSTFLRPKFSLSKRFEKLNKLVVGGSWEREKNERSLIATDSLSKESFDFEISRLYLLSNDEAALSYGLELFQRVDYLPFFNSLQKISDAKEIRVNGKWNQKNNSNLNWNFTIRNLEVSNTNLTGLQAKDTYLGKLEYGLQAFKGIMRSNTVYEIGSGQEPKREFTFVEVDKGLGQYVYNDFNEDGIRQVNEYEIAPFEGDGNFIRVSVFNDEFIRTNTISFSQSLRFDPRSQWYGKKGLLKFMSKFSTVSSLLINRKNKESADISALNPFDFKIADTALVSLSSGIRNTLFFNRANPKYDLQFGNNHNASRVVFTAGYESRQLSEYFGRIRLNFGKSFSAISRISTGYIANDSEFFDNKDYKIDIKKLEPELTYLVSSSLRLALKYKFQEKKNVLDNALEEATFNNFELETTFRKSAKSSFRTSFSLVSVDYQDNGNTAVDFIILEGLKNGKNYLWSANFDQRLTDNIQLSISYDGRKTGTSKVVHLGRAQVRATF